MSTEPASAFDGVTILRLRPVFFVLAAIILTLTAAMLWLTPGGASIGQFVQLALSGVFLLSRARSMRRALPVAVTVRDDRLLVDGAPLCPLGAIESAFVVPGAGEARTVRLLRRRRLAVELGVRDQAHAAALMRALGLGPTQWAASYMLPAQRGDYRQLWVLMLLFALVFPVAGLTAWIAGLSAALRLANVLFPSVILVTIVLGATGALTPRLLVGTDGVSLAFAGRTRFVPYDRIADVAVRVVKARRCLVLRLTDGEVLEIAVRNESGTPQSASDRLGLFPEQIADRIREARAAATSSEAEAAILRGSGPPAERIRAMRALGREGRQGYRIAPITTEQLWRVFESSSADAQARVGAAIALRERLDEPCRRRLRVVAAATAAPDLRAAIERAAGDDDAALEEALASLDPPDAAPPLVIDPAVGRRGR